MFGTRKARSPSSVTARPSNSRVLRDANDIEELHALVKKHYLYTESDVAKRLMDDWDLALTQFVKVMPTDYKRVLAERAVTAA